MQAKNHKAANFKLLCGIIFLCLFFSMINTGNLTSAQAQQGATNTPTPEIQVTTLPPKEIQIVGGAPADPGEYPWQVELNIYDPTFGVALCGGSLIHPQWVLTAAHCITQSNGGISSPGNIYVYAGEYDRTGPYYTYRGVSQVIRHPAYNENTLDSDIALINLDAPLTIGNGVNPPYTKIATIPPALASLGSLAGSNAWITGWGRTSYGGNTSAILLEVQLPIMDNTICNNGSHWMGQITSNMLCAGNDAGTQSTCQGDSGGPLIVWNAGTGQWNLAGVTSFGPVGCAVPYLPSVFTRVSQYQSWLSSYLPSSALTGSVTGSGTITSNPSGINCPGDCTETYGYNNIVTLTATPAAGYMFSGWNGACSGSGSCIVSMTEAKSVGVTFTPKLFNDPGKWTSAFDLSHGWTVADYARTVGDINGDGRADLVGFGLDGVYVALALNPGPGFGAVSKWTSAFDLSHGWTVANYVRTVGDVNADGMADLVGFGLDGVYVALSTGSGFDPVSKWTSAFDLAHGWTVSQFVRTVGDVNGDNRADLIGFGLDGVYVALSTGSGFSPVSKWTSAFDLSHGWTVSQYVRTVGDINADGQADLIGFGLDGVYAAISTGNGFGSVSRWTSDFDLSHGWTVSQFVRTVGDANADGKADLVGFGLDGVYVASAK